MNATLSDLMTSGVSDARAAMAEAGAELVRRRRRIAELERQLARVPKLYAKIKTSSEYRYQHDGKVPFPVGVGDFGPHIVFGNDNRYRIEDLRFYVKAGDKFLELK
jgi:hypothetical protein